VRSFLTDRTQQIAYSGQLSAGAVWGYARIRNEPAVVSSLYTAELSLVVTPHGLNLHQYADDTQVYVSTAASQGR